MKTTVNLKGWKSKVLSQVSRSIIIKVVAQAIPTYVMSTNLFPKVFVTKWILNSEIYGGITISSVTFSCSNVVCSPKTCGGLGFRKLYDFKSLISKLAWLMASNKDLLWVQQLKFKYRKRKSMVLLGFGMILKTLEISSRKVFYFRSN